MVAHLSPKKVKKHQSIKESKQIHQHLAILNGDFFSWDGLNLLKSSMTPQLLDSNWITNSKCCIKFHRPKLGTTPKKNNNKSVPCANPSWLMVNEPFWARGSILRQNNVLNGRYTSNKITKSHINCHTLCNIEDPGKIPSIHVWHISRTISKCR